MVNSCTVAAGAEQIVNTATVTLPAGQTDPFPEGNSATDETAVAIFIDGFESGNISAWSTSVGRAAAATVELVVPADQLAARFLVDGEALRLVRARSDWILVGLSDDGTAVFALELRRTAVGLEQRARVRLDDGGWATSRWVGLSEAAAALDLEWRASWSSEHPDGALLLSIDGELLIWLTELDNGVQRLRSLDFFAIRGRRVLSEPELSPPSGPGH